MSNYFHVNTLFVCIALSVLSSGCTKRPQPGWVEFAISNPGHENDWLQLETALRDESIRLGGVRSDVGMQYLEIDARDFDAAKRTATSLITRNSLTLRILSHSTGWEYEVWESGRKVRLESYVIDSKK